MLGDLVIKKKKGDLVIKRKCMDQKTLLPLFQLDFPSFIIKNGEIVKEEV